MILLCNFGNRSSLLCISIDTFTATLHILLLIFILSWWWIIKIRRIKFNPKFESLHIFAIILSYFLDNLTCLFISFSSVKETWALWKENKTNDETNTWKSHGNVTIHPAIDGNKPELKSNVAHCNSKNIENPQASVVLVLRWHEFDCINVCYIVAPSLWDSTHENDEVQQIQVFHEKWGYNHAKEYNEPDQIQRFASINIRSSRQDKRSSKCSNEKSSTNQAWLYFVETLKVYLCYPVVKVVLGFGVGFNCIMRSIANSFKSAWFPLRAFCCLAIPLLWYSLKILETVQPECTADHTHNDNHKGLDLKFTDIASLLDCIFNVFYDFAWSSIPNYGVYIS